MPLPVVNLVQYTVCLLHTLLFRKQQQRFRNLHNMRMLGCGCDFSALRASRLRRVFTAMEAMPRDTGREHLRHNVRIGNTRQEENFDV